MSVILTDCDGVLADFVSALCERLAKHGITRRPEDFRHWDLSEAFSSEEMRIVSAVMAERNFCRSICWYPGAAEFLKALASEGQVHAVTAPFRSSPWWMYERLDWLSAQMPGDRVHFVSGKYKQIVRGDILIEDHPLNAVDWLEINPSGVAILIDRPWNSPSAKEFWPHEQMYRVRSYSEALDVVRKVSK